MPAFIYVADKMGNRVRLHPNRMQRDMFARHKAGARRTVQVKARQQGSSTGWRALFFQETIWHPDFRFVQVLETEQKAKRDKAIVASWYEHLKKTVPQWTPTIGVNNATSMTFPGINSRIDFYWAEGETPGRGDTINRLLCSEIAHWPDARKTLSALLPSVPPAPYGEVVLESTPFGAGGLFYDVYQAAKRGDGDFKWDALFYPWWFSDEYGQFSLPSADIEKTLRPDEKKLVAQHGLSLQQLQWRRETMASSEMSGGFFLQEYPEDDESCFYSSGTHVFATNLIHTLRQNQYDPRETPEEWLEDGYGDALRVWKEPLPQQRFVIGVDTAEGLGGPGRDADYSAAAVIDWRTCEHVASLRSNRLSPERFAVLLDRLGRRYGTKGTPAFLAVERRSSGYAVLNELEKLGYPNLYGEVDNAARTKGYKEYATGWLTNRLTKPVMISDFAELLRTGQFVTHDATLVSEIQNYVYDTKGHDNNPAVDLKALAGPGQHDDLLMAAMIAVQVRDSAPLPDADRPQPKRLVSW